MSVVWGDGCVRPSHRRGSGASARGTNIPGLRARKGANGDAAACVGYDAMARMQRGRQWAVGPPAKCTLPSVNNGAAVAVMT